MKPTRITQPEHDAPKVAGPTVIKASGSGQGTNGSSPPVHKPTVMPTTTPGHKPEEKVVRAPVKPTVIKGGPATEAPPAKVEVPRVSHPTVLAGSHVRERIPVTVEQLGKANTGASQEVCERAVQIILTTNLDELNDRSAVLFGNDLQRRYGELVTLCLMLSRTQALQKIAGYINRMLTILGAINLKKVCGLEAGNGFLAKLVGSVTDAIDTPAELEKAQHELEQLLNLMGAQIDPLLELKRQMETASDEIDELGSMVESSAIAANFLSDYLLQTKPGETDLIRILSERSMSLTQTLAQIRTSEAMREAQVQQPLRLINATQQVALVTVPQWLGSVVSLRAAIGATPTVTEVDELGDQLAGIIAQMKGQP